VTDILATDRLAHRVEAARTSGAATVWVANGLAGHVGDDPIDVAIECGGTDGAVHTALELVRPGGHVVLVGIPDDDRTSFRASLARRKGVTISLSRRMRASDLVLAAEMVAAGRLSLDGLATHVVGLPDVAEAFAIQAARDGLKVVVRPQHANV
jgi:L-iditol 2-dehydrogenase